MASKMIVIGAGPGGLAAALMLAGKGYEVDVYEKQPYVGGRNSSINLDGFTFDMGPTFLSMVHIAEEIFQSAGKNLHDYVDLKEIDDLYELIFENESLHMTRNPEEMKKRIDEIAPGDGDGYARFMADTERKMDKLSPILQSRMDRFHHYLSPRVLKALPDLTVTKSLYGVLSDYFMDERIKLAFTFQSKYLGMSPWECPGAFSILSYMEHAYGIYHPIGGVNQLSKAMAKAFEELGGRIHLGQGVKKLLHEGKKAKGILLESGEKIEADEVIINGDFAHVMTNLLEEGVSKKFSKAKLSKKKFSCSTFMIYLGLDKIYDLPHHTILFAKDYKKNVEAITKTFDLSDDISIYIQNASVTDPTLAPAGKSALYVLAPVPSNLSGISWEEKKETFRRLILETVEKRTGFKDLENHIVTEKIISPLEWEKDIFVYKGATFNLGHQLSQMMVLRPHNKFDELDHCWLVGGGTHPGSGLPTILESARITVNGIFKKDHLPQIKAGPGKRAGIG
ncbi:phytoene desaturase [Metabacillus sp. GX 13764]|uniref:phytoene desaturase family protein n=1 Tax=Metabacillus kandeliae TaxID=2900151 RepID=UPI001E42D87F|nr:phytoene desaturase family protein [Metabacillus kandeliae]MCD7034911.1 phytoene desaturase [Metabacillus kandeliae]